MRTSSVRSSGGESAAAARFAGARFAGVFVERDGIDFGIAIPKDRLGQRDSRSTYPIARMNGLPAIGRVRCDAAELQCVRASDVAAKGESGAIPLGA